MEKELLISYFQKKYDLTGDPLWLAIAFILDCHWDEIKGILPD